MARTTATPGTSTPFRLINGWGLRGRGTGDTRPRFPVPTLSLTILVVPFPLIRIDLVQRCQEEGLFASPGRSHPDHLVSPLIEEVLLASVRHRVHRNSLDLQFPQALEWRSPLPDALDHLVQ